MIYADNAATTQMGEAAINAMTACMRDTWGNPSILYGLGQRAKEALEDAREQGIKKNQDAEIALTLDSPLDFSEDELATLFIVSKVTVAQGQDTAVSVKLSEAPKCPRCWNHDERIGTDGHHEELCDRCAHVLESEQ